MSEPRHNWWPFALNMIRDYPSRRAIYQGEKTTPEQERTQEYREYKAVREAVEMTSLMDAGDLRLKVVQMTEFKRTHYLAGAAMKLNIGDRSARRYRWQFILLVGYRYGCISQEEYYRELSRDNPRVKDSKGQA